MHYDAARRTLYIFGELTRYKSGNRQMADTLLKYGITSEDRITADSAEPKSIADYRNYGLHCRGAVKGPGSVDYSMKWLQSLVEIVIDPVRCPDTAKEFTTYEYERNKDGEVISGYPDKDDHHISAVRYNKANNDIANLEIMPKGKHSFIHCTEMVNADPERVKDNLDRIRPMTTGWHRSEEGRQWHKEHYEKTKGNLYRVHSFVCKQCGTPFESSQVKSRFCSNACKAKWRRENGLDDEKRVCIVCGKEFSTNKFKNQRTCSRSCANRLRKIKIEN